MEFHKYCTFLSTVNCFGVLFEVGVEVGELTDFYELFQSFCIQTYHVYGVLLGQLCWYHTDKIW